MLRIVLLVVVLVLLVGGLLTWGWHGYGPWRSGLVAILLVIVLVLLLTGHL